MYEDNSNTPAPEVNLHPTKILLVEDDDALAEMYATRLSAEGYETKRAPDGEGALAAAISYKPRLILLDVMMPKISGFDVLDILKNTPETSQIKIVMLTARGQDSDQERAKQLGADDYIIKSQVLVDDIVTRIAQHLS